ncbi:MAG: hypothetical protein HY718_19960 [Planctomycetes bacterium]|nr:hypothetical protein [Planctomycetota bacterium]
MSGQAMVLRAPWAGWIIRRNPTYLLSAACMAVGARLYLVSPSTRAGDVGLILLTLGILQAYEWAVTAILLALSRWRRSPEDQPSLLLVAVLFWTGPLAATAEMTAHRVVPGLICAGAACAFALAELAAVRRVLGLRFSQIGRLAVAACVVLLAIAPPLLRVPESVSGTNEVFLYAAWWLIGAIGLAGLAVVRHHVRRPGPDDGYRDFALELAMLALVVAATVAHLVGMNYAYFGHARWFYGSPLIVAVAVVIMEFVASTDRLRIRLSSLTVLNVAVLLPAAAIVLAREPFDARLPVRMLPVFLRDPLLTTLVMAAAAWWFGYRRLRLGLLLHAGSAAMGWAILRAMKLHAGGSGAVQAVAAGPDATRNLIVAGLYLIAGYFLLMALIRRSRPEALTAVIVHQLALTMLVWDRTYADVLLVCLGAGWHWLVCLHLLGRPSLTAGLLPIVFLLLVTWGYDVAPELCWHARSHAAAMLLVLVVVTVVRPASRYGFITACTAIADGLFYAGRWVGNREHATAAFVVIGAFVLLAAGAAISWRKRALLDRLGEERGRESLFDINAWGA